MEKRKTSFVLHLDMLEDIEEMTTEEKAELLDFVVGYNKGTLKIDDVKSGSSRRFFRLFANQFDRDHDKWMNTKQKRQEAGKKGGLAKASKCYQMLPNASDAKHKVNVNVEVKEEVKVKVKEEGEVKTEKSLSQKSENQLRIEKLFNRRPSTPLDKAETSAWKSAKAVIEELTDFEWTKLEAFYAAPQRETYRRKTLATLLNNLSGEVENALQWKPQHNNNNRTLIGAAPIT